MNTRIILITGALTGIGRATALAFAREGGNIVVHQPKQTAMKLVSAAFIVTVYKNDLGPDFDSFPRSGDAQPEQTGQRVSGSRAVLQFECSALVRVREPNHFRASRILDLARRETGLKIISRFPHQGRGR